jgi:DEAD/DEAH box helicase domain-containing protein
LPLPAELLEPADGRWVFFDLETLRGADEVGGWDRIRDMGLALAVTLDATTGLFTTWYERDAEALAELLLGADRVVGFNLDRFDLTVLEAYAGPRIRQVRSLDLLTLVYRRLGFRVSLGHLAQETLGAPKLADGLQSLAWVREGRLDLVEPYCRADVRLTAALWAHGRSKGHLLFRNREGLRGKVPVQW